MGKARHKPPDWLSFRTGESHRAFVKLADAVCTNHTAESGDREHPEVPRLGLPCVDLAWWFAMLAARKKGFELGNGTRLAVDDMDSYDTAIGVFRWADIRALEQEAHEIIATIEALAQRAQRFLARVDMFRETPLVRDLVERKLLPPRDTITRFIPPTVVIDDDSCSEEPTRPDETPVRFKKVPIQPDYDLAEPVLGYALREISPFLSRVKDAAKAVLGDPRKSFSTDTDSYLYRLYRLIHKHTGFWHDQLVADILNDIRPEKDWTQTSLKQWRYRQGLSDPPKKRVTRKRSC